MEDDDLDEDDFYEDIDDNGFGTDYEEEEEELLCEQCSAPIKQRHKHTFEEPLCAEERELAQWLIGKGVTWSEANQFLRVVKGYINEGLFPNALP